MKKSVEKSDDFLRLIKEWLALEDTTIENAEKLIDKTDNPLVKMTMEMIKDDSEKHKVMQQMIIDNLTKEALRLTPEDIVPLSEMLNSHMQAEAKSIEIANAALQKSGLFVTRYILSYLMADERKHHMLLEKLNEVKKASVFVT